MKYGILRSASKGLWFTVEKYREKFQIVKVYHDKYKAEHTARQLQREHDANKAI